MLRGGTDHHRAGAGAHARSLSPGRGSSSAKAYYLTSWGEILSGCTMYQQFSSRYDSMRQTALSDSDWSDYRHSWRAIRERYPSLYPNMMSVNVQTDATFVHPEVVAQMMNATGLNRPRTLRLIQAGIASELETLSAFKLSVIADHFRNISGHAAALNERILTPRAAWGRTRAPRIW